MSGVTELQERLRVVTEAVAEGTAGSSGNSSLVRRQCLLSLQGEREKERERLESEIERERE